MILNVLAEKLSRTSKVNFKGQNFETSLIVRAVSWHLRYPLSCCDLASIFAERGFESKNRVAFQSAPAHFDALYPQVGRAFKRGTRPITAGGRRYDRLPVRSYSYGRCGAF